MVCCVCVLECWLASHHHKQHMVDLKNKKTNKNKNKSMDKINSAQRFTKSARLEVREILNMEIVVVVNLDIVKKFLPTIKRSEGTNKKLDL